MLSLKNVSKRFSGTLVVDDARSSRAPTMVPSVISGTRSRCARGRAPRTAPADQAMAPPATEIPSAVSNDTHG